MLFHGALLEFEHEADLSDVEGLGRRTWELGDFIVNGLGVRSWPGRFDAAVALHRSCHTRGTGAATPSRSSSGSIAGVRLVEFGEGSSAAASAGRSRWASRTSRRPWAT
jgi:L-lactate dehydrogenase complex protein LldE